MRPLGHGSERVRWVGREPDGPARPELGNRGRKLVFGYGGRVRLVTRLEQLLAGDLGGAVVVFPGARVTSTLGVGDRPARSIRTAS